MASLTVTAILALILAGSTLGGADPVTVIYNWLVGLGTDGLLTVLVVVSVSIVAFLALQNYTLLGNAGEQAILLLALIPIAAAIGWFLVGSRTRRGLETDYAADLVV